MRSPYRQRHILPDRRNFCRPKAQIFMNLSGFMGIPFGIPGKSKSIVNPSLANPLGFDMNPDGFLEI